MKTIEIPADQHLVGVFTVIKNGELQESKPIFGYNFRKGEFAYIKDIKTVVIVNGLELDHEHNEVICYDQKVKDNIYSCGHNREWPNTVSLVRRPTQEEIEDFIKAKNPESSFKSGWYFDDKQLKAVYMVEKTKCIFELDSKQNANDQPFELINSNLTPLNKEESEKMDTMLKVFGYIIRENKLVSIWKPLQRLIMSGFGEVILENETSDGKVFLRSGCLHGSQIGHKGLRSLDANKILSALTPKRKTFKTKVGNKTFELPVELKPLIDKIENIIGND